MDTRMLPCSLSHAPFDFSAYTEQGPAHCLGTSAAHSELDLTHQIILRQSPQTHAQANSF